MQDFAIIGKSQWNFQAHYLLRRIGHTHLCAALRDGATGVGHLSRHSLTTLQTAAASSRHSITVLGMLKAILI